MVPDLKTYLTLAIFVIYWVQLALPIKSIKVGRTVVSMLSGSLMVSLQVLTPLEAFNSISSNTLMLLFGLMLILAKLETKGLNHYLKALLLYNEPSPRSLLIRVSMLSSFLAAFIMNDGAAIFLTGTVMDIVEEFDLLVEPFAMAVATSSNLGSASTVLGNPKNMIVEEHYPELTFLTFSLKMGPPALIATVINTVLLHLYYYSELDSLPLVTTTKKPMQRNESLVYDDEDLDRCSLDSDVLDLEQQYLNSKMYSEVDGLNSLSLITPIDNNNLNHQRNQSPTYCARITETPHNYRTVSFDEEPSYNFGSTSSPNYGSLSQFDQLPNFNLNKETTSEDGKSSILSPALSFQDLDNDLDLRSTPTYVWPTQPTTFRKRKFTGIESDLPIVEVGIDTQHPPTPPPPTSPLVNDIPISATVYKFKLLLTFITLILMYVAFVFKFPLGWTCLTAALLILLIDNQDSNHLITEHVNWNLLVYLVGTFILLRGVQKTKLNKKLFDLVQPTLINGNLPVMMKILVFVGLILTLSFMFTSIPTVLMVLPYLNELKQDNLFFKNVYFLLAWSVTLTGNLMPFGSVAGLIVSEMSKDYCTPDFEEEIHGEGFEQNQFHLHTNLNLKGQQPRRRSKNRWIGNLNVWSKFATWSTVILLLTGAFLVCWN